MLIMDLLCFILFIKFYKVLINQTIAISISLVDPKTI